MSQGVNREEFVQSVWQLQRSAVEAAEEEARMERTKNPDVDEAKAGQLARKICRRARKTFENSVMLQYPSDEDRDLVELTLESRSTLFLVTLPFRLADSIRGVQPKGKEAEIRV